MLLEQLKADYRLIVRVLEKERRMREHVFPPGHRERTAKLEELVDALQALQRIKELLKAQLQMNVEPDQQLPLLEMPTNKKGTYQ